MNNFYRPQCRSCSLQIIIINDEITIELISCGPRTVFFCLYLTRFLERFLITAVTELLFYRCFEHCKCHGMTRRMQTFHKMKFHVCLSSFLNIRSSWPFWMNFVWNLCHLHHAHFNSLKLEKQHGGRANCEGERH